MRYLVLLLTLTQAGCLAAAAGYAGAKLAQSDDVYVCAAEPNAGSVDEVVRMYEEDDDESWVSKTGDQVEILQREATEMQDNGRTRPLDLALVESKNIGRVYWISVDALCSD